MADEKETNLPEVADAKTREVSLMGGIIPKDFSELTRFASLVHQSRLAPKGFDTVEKVAIGLLTNMELGRPIITGLQDLAIINGRCGIYGDASLAMVTASGKMDEGYPKSTETGTPYTDDWTFSFTVKRIGRPEETGVWTWVDAKRAGFDAPKTKDGREDIWSPWARFTRRMMQWKARNFVMRDNFGDVLKGMKTVEDLHDLDPIPMSKQPDGSFSTTSKTGSVSDLADKIKEKAEEKDQLTSLKEEAGRAGEVVDAEFKQEDKTKDPLDTQESPPDAGSQGSGDAKKQASVMINPATAQAFSELTNGDDAGTFWRMREVGLALFFGAFENVMNTWPKDVQAFIEAKCKNIAGKHPEFLERFKTAMTKEEESKGAPDIQDKPDQEQIKALADLCTKAALNMEEAKEFRTWALGDEPTGEAVSALITGFDAVLADYVGGKVNVARKEDSGEDWNGLKSCPKMNNMNIPKIRCKDCEDRSTCSVWGGGMEQF